MFTACQGRKGRRAIAIANGQDLKKSEPTIQEQWEAKELLERGLIGNTEVNQDATCVIQGG